MVGNIKCFTLFQSFQTCCMVSFQLPTSKVWKSLITFPGICWLRFVFLLDFDLNRRVKTNTLSYLQIMLNKFGFIAGVVTFIMKFWQRSPLSFSVFQCILKNRWLVIYKSDFSLKKNLSFCFLSQDRQNN